MQHSMMGKSEAGKIPGHDVGDGKFKASLGCLTNWVEERAAHWVESRLHRHEVLADL